MSRREIVQEVSGFYPLFEELLKNYDDLITPAVFGVAWRYCQMKDGVCKASLRTIADILNISEATVMRRMEILCNDGYLIDTTPDARNVPHVYADAGRVVMKSHLGVVETVSHRNSTQTARKTVSPRNESVSQGNATVSGSQLIKDSNKESNKEKEEEGRNPLFSFYENKIGAITPLMADAIEKAEKVYTPKWVADAIELASQNGARHWNYCEKVLDRWKREGRVEKSTKKQTAAASGDPNKYVDPKWQEYIA